MPAACLGAIGFAATAEAGPFDKFTGSFAASGTVTEGPSATSRRVRCSFASAQRGQAGLSLRGTCWAYVVISRTVSAELSVDAASGKVTGTYTGARVGPASLSGSVQDTAIDLLVTWPRPLYENPTSRMKIVSLDGDHLRIQVLSRIGENGPVRATTDLSLVRR
jgi:hypothetical protein